MPRKNLIRSNHFPYHVTARANNKCPFPLDLTIVWKVATEELYSLSVLYEIEIHAFVVMPNHFHLLLTVPNEDLGKIMNLFMSNITRILNKLSGKSGHVFGGPYFWSIITSTRYFGHVLKYVYRNPVKGGLCLQVEEYEFSTASGTFGIHFLPIPIHLTRLGLELNLPETTNPNGWLEWLNRPFPGETEKLIQQCMRKKKIDELLNRNKRRAQRELSQLL